MLNPSTETDGSLQVRVGQFGKKINKHNTPYQIQRQGEQFVLTWPNPNLISLIQADAATHGFDLVDITPQQLESPPS